MSTSSASPAQQPKRASRARAVALIAGVLAVLGAIAVPFLPVKERTAALQWPSRVIGNTNAPLVSYFPESFDLSLPCRAVAAQAGRTEGSTLFSTIPPSSSLATTRGLVVRLTGPQDARSLQVVLRGETLLVVEAAKFADPGCGALTVHATRDTTTVEARGIPGASVTRPGSNLRPQIIGFYTDLAGMRDDEEFAGLAAKAAIDTRFLTEPTGLKLGVLVATAGEPSSALGPPGRTGRAPRARSA